MIGVIDILLKVITPLSCLSLLAIWCVTSRSETVRKWGPIFGLFSQSFWMYNTYIAAQWDMFTLAFVYTFMWTRGIWNGWRKA